METMRLVSFPLPKAAFDIRLIHREWGIERYYRLQNGSQLFNPAIIKYMKLNTPYIT